MSYEEVSEANNLVIGTKQTLKALEHGMVKKIFIANDARSSLIESLTSLATERDIPIEYVNSMKKLGRACGIEVGAATVALII